MAAKAHLFLCRLDQAQVAVQPTGGAKPKPLNLFLFRFSKILSTFLNSYQIHPSFKNYETSFVIFLKS